jgi:hypothetical protein
VNRPSGGGGVAAATAFGEIHSSGGATSTGTREPTGPRRPRRYAAIWRAACRPDRAATSAVSAACTRLPAANTPSAEVASAVSTAGPLVPGSMDSPAVRARVQSGIQSAEKTRISHGTKRAVPPCVPASSTPLSRPSVPATRRTSVDVQTSRRQRSAAAARNAA